MGDMGEEIVWNNAEYVDDEFALDINVALFFHNFKSKKVRVSLTASLSSK